MAHHRSTEIKIAALRERLGGPYEPAMRRATVVRGIGRRGLEWAVRGGEITAVLPGIYVASSRVNEHRVRCAAVALWSGNRILVAGESALHLINETYPAPTRVRCIGPPQWSARTPTWIDLTRRPLPQFTQSGAGVRCLTSEDAVLDAWARAPRQRRPAVLYEALWLRIPGPRRLVGAAARLPRLPDRARFDAIMRDFLDGATSPAEVMAKHEVFVGAEFTELEWQVEIRVAGRKRFPDAMHRRARVAVEFDGEGYHSSARAVRRDRSRDAELASEGWQTIRFSFRDLKDRPDWCRAMVRRLVATRLGPDTRLR